MTTAYNWPDLRRGDDFNLVVTYTTDGDLTNAEIMATWRDSRDNHIVFTRANIAAGGSAAQIAMTTPASGIFTIYIVPSNTSSLDIKSGGSVLLWYDVQVTLATGEVHTILAGNHTIVADMTR